MKPCVLLANLDSRYKGITDSLIYRTIAECQEIIVRDTVIIIRNPLRRGLFHGKTIISIEIRRNSLELSLPNYAQKTIAYRCRIDDRLVDDDGKIRALNIFKMLYNDFIKRINSHTSVTAMESLFLAGIKTSIDNYALRVASGTNIYIDNILRLTDYYQMIFDGIINVNDMFDEEIIIACFSGLSIDFAEIPANEMDNIVYLHTNNTVPVGILDKFPSVMYLDIQSDYDYKRMNKCKSVKVNDIIVKGNSPMQSFLVNCSPSSIRTSYSENVDIPSLR